MGGLSVCPDGAHALFFMPNKETKALNIWRLDLQSGSATALTNGKVDQNPVCSPDSKYVSLYQPAKGQADANGNAAGWRASEATKR